MTARRIKGSTDPEQSSILLAADKAPRQKPIEHSLYFGRERLGRYVKIDRETFKAFDFKNRRLGSFRTRAGALAAIREAWARLA
jgi:hypothetical protein